MAAQWTKWLLRTQRKLKDHGPDKFQIQACVSMIKIKVQQNVNIQETLLYQLTCSKLRTAKLPTLPNTQSCMGRI